MATLKQILPLSGPMIDHVDINRAGSDQGTVRRRTNMRPDYTGNLFANKPIKGTIQIDDIELPAGENKVLGWCSDGENDAIVYMVWNANQDHCVFRLHVLTDTVEKIFFAEPTLNFTDNTVINACVVDGRIYWNDNTDQPKSFNLNKASNYTNASSGDAYTTDDQPFDENIFPMIKKPPRWKPDIEYQSLPEDPDDDTKDIVFNNLRKKQWQFKYNYIYEDYQESPYSPISVVMIPEVEISAAGIWDKNITLNNAIKVRINTGPRNVKSIRVAVRDASNRNSGDFYEFRKIDKFDSDGNQLILSDSVYDIYFLNNTYLQNINTDISNAYFHNVPLVAKDMLLIDRKYLAQSMPKEGYDFDENQLDYELSYNTNTATFETSGFDMLSTVQYAYDPWRECGYRGDYRIVAKIAIPVYFEPNSTYTIRISRPAPFSDVTVSYSTGSVEPAGYPTVVRDYFINELRDQIDECSEIPIKIRPFTSNENYIRLDFYGPINDNNGHPSTESIEAWGRWYEVLMSEATKPFGRVVTAVSSPTYVGLKRGQYHRFVIVYNDDKGRYNIAFGDEELYSPLINIESSPETENTVITPRITINSRPPIWATTYRLAYIPYNSYTYCLYVPGVEVVTGEGVPSGYYFLKINQAILDIIDQFPNTQISAYVWQNGDRIREYGKEDSYEILKEHVREYTEDDETKVESGYLIDTALTTSGSPERITCIEIYRPNLAPQDKLYYEIGEEYEIENPGTSIRTHKGNTQDQSSDLSTPAIVDSDFGDVYYRIRLSINAPEGFVYVEDNNLSDYYVSDGISIGRGVVRTESKQSVLKRIVISENYIANTKLNRLNVMLPQAESYTVSETFGDITRLVERGDVLKIIQAHKETSIYVGKNYAKDGAGGNIILNTDNIFGSENIYESYAGSSYPRAVAVSEKYMYFYDHINGDFYRSAANGTESISVQYGLNEWFDQKAESFRQYSGIKDIIVFYQKPTDTVWLSFITGTTIETIVFSENESSKGFMFFVELNNGELIPENMAWYGDYTYLFCNGHVHKLGAGNDNEFLGSTRKESSIEVIANQYPEIQKSFETLAINSDGDWTVIAEIESDNNYPFGQKTKIFSQRFQKREGVLTAGIPTNIINRAGTEDLSKLYAGNKMAGNAIKITASSSNFGVLREMKVESLNQK